MPKKTAAGEKKPIRLTVLFLFLLFCAAVYYASQFHIVSNFGGDVEKRRALAANRLKDVYDQVATKQAHMKRRLTAAQLKKNRTHNSARFAKVARLAAAAAAAEPPTQQPIIIQQPTIQQQQQETQPVATVPAQLQAPPQATALQCNRTRRPMHVVMTAATGLYQEWQSRIAYYHYKKMKRLHPCSDLGGFTRLYNSYNAAPDSLMEEIPTLVVKQLGHGNCAECDRGFIVMNRPWGAVQFVETEYFRNRIEEEYIFIIETDHMMMKPPENLATPDTPVGFGFYYMLGTDPKLKPVVEKFLDAGIESSTVDAVGPSPIIIHKPMLAKVARPWWDMSQRMQKDRDAQVIFGWVLEMWGYNLAARNMGIRHLVSKDIQVEPQGEGTDDMDTKTIYHYTFGLTPKPPFPGARSWRLDKRMFYGGYPSDHLEMPPACTAKSGFIIASMWNEAAQAISGWKTKSPPRIGGDAHADSLQAQLYQQTTPEAPDGLGAMLRGTGPWKWGRLSRAFFFSRGIFYVAGPDPASKGPLGIWAASPSDPSTVVVTVCAKTYTLKFESATAPWSFAAQDSDGRSTSGRLDNDQQRNPELLPGVAVERLRPAAAGAATAPLVSDIAGSGPWIWAGSGPLSFMRGGVLITPWGTGTWGVSRSGGTEAAPDDTVFADFAGSQHNVRLHIPECLRMQSRRKADGDVVGIHFAGNGADTASKNAETCQMMGLGTP